MFALVGMKPVFLFFVLALSIPFYFFKKVQY